MGRGSMVSRQTPWRLRTVVPVVTLTLISLGLPIIEAHAATGSGGAASTRGSHGRPHTRDVIAWPPPQGSPHAYCFVNAKVGTYVNSGQTIPVLSYAISCEYGP